MNSPYMGSIFPISALALTHAEVQAVYHKLVCLCNLNMVWLHEEGTDLLSVRYRDCNVYSMESSIFSFKSVSPQFNQYLCMSTSLYYQ